jgi:hypothetical protein
LSSLLLLLSSSLSSSLLSSSSSSLSSLVTGLFFLVLLLNQQWSPLLRVQVSDCSTSHIVCDIPSIAVFCSESIEFFHGMVSKFFFKPFVTIPVALVITSIIIHFMFYIGCISIHQLLYFSCFFLMLPFAWHFYPQVLPHRSVCMFSLSCF